MAKQTKVAQPVAQPVNVPGIPAGRPTVTTTSMCNVNVTLTHMYRRRYAVTFNGKVQGAICAANASNAIARIASNTIAGLKLLPVNKLH